MSKEGFAGWLKRADSFSGLGGGERHASITMARSLLNGPVSWVDEKFVVLESPFGSKVATTPLGWVAKEVGRYGKGDLLGLTKALVSSGADPNLCVFDGYEPVFDPYPPLSIALGFLDMDGGDPDDSPIRFGVSDGKSLSISKDFNKWFSLMVECGAKIPVRPMGLSPYVFPILGKGFRKDLMEIMVSSGVESDIPFGAKNATAWDVIVVKMVQTKVRKDTDYLVSLMGLLANASFDPNRKDENGMSIIECLKEKASVMERKSLPSISSEIWKAVSEMEKRKLTEGREKKVRLEHRSV